MMCSAYKLNEQDENIQPSCTPFWILNQSVVPYKVLTVASWPTYRFLRKQVRRSGIPISLSVFYSLLISTTVKGFSVVSETEMYVFLEFPCFLYDPANVGNLISCSPAFSKPRLYIWKFAVHVLLRLSLEDFEHNLTSMRDECNCPVVWKFLSTALLGDWDEDWPLPVLWPLLGFPNLLTYWAQHFNSIIF